MEKKSDPIRFYAQGTVSNLLPDIGNCMPIQLHTSAIACHKREMYTMQYNVYLSQEPSLHINQATRLGRCLIIPEIMWFIVNAYTSKISWRIHQSAYTLQ